MKPITLLLVVTSLFIANHTVASDQNDSYRVGSACFVFSDAEQLVGEDSDEILVITFQMVETGRCVGTVVLESDWSHGIVIKGVRMVLSYPYPGYGMSEVITLFANGNRPEKRIMHFADQD